MELHCGLSFHFSADWRCWASFHMLIDHVYLLSVFSRILTIFYWIISVLLIICRNSLCILNTVYTLSFNFLNSAFWWELFAFDEVQFIKFYFMFSVFGVLSKKSLYNFRLWRFSPVFSCRSLIVFAFALRAMIHPKLIFVCGVSGSVITFFIHLFSCSSTIYFFY